jgi:S1-C subfamily serine protease
MRHLGKKFSLFVIILWLLSMGTLYAENLPGRVQPELLKAVVKIELPPEENGFIPTGTGFLVSRETAINGTTSRRTFLVTNKHVLGDWNAADGDIVNYNDYINVYFYRTVATSGRYYELLKISLKDKNGKPIRKIKIHANPIIDIAVIALDEELSPSNNIDLFSFDVSYLLPFDKITMWLTGLGDQVFAMGYPLGITSSKNNYPIAKSGYLASLPGEEFLVNFPAVNRKKETIKTKIEGKILVVDGLIVGGNSGGPVVLPIETKVRRDPKTNQLQFATEATKNFVIGIVSSFLGPSGVSIAYSSDYVQELIEQHLSDNSVK